MGIHVGVNGTPKEVVGVYVGVNGTPKECSDIYVGVNGTPKSCYSGVKPGETIFTSSSTFTVPKGVKKIDVFCVGGGGGGNTSRYGYVGSSVWDFAGGGGGGGGYTTTVLNVDVTPGDTIPVVVGAGGSNSDGGLTSAMDICSAYGGKLGGKYDANYSVTEPEYRQAIGGNGGSGGGAGCAEYCFYVCRCSNGGVDGNDADISLCTVPFVGSRPAKRDTNGKGQHTTTRYFEESKGTIYAGGGCGGYESFNGYSNSVNPTIQSDGTGNGGNGAGGGWVCVRESDERRKSTTAAGINGSSGICIIRWGKQ